MKHNRRTEYPAYPGAADPVYIRDRNLNIVLSVVSGIGLVTALAYLLLL